MVLFRPGRAVVFALLLLYWGVSLRHLAIVPRVYEDEPWQASTGWKLAIEGVFGSDLFAGFYGMERHYYGYMPVHPLLLAATFRLGGLGLFQARLEAVIMGLLGLALTYALGRRLFGRRVGLLGVALLMLVRTAGLTPSQYTGIIWLDFARIARYDMVVPVLGLAALHAYLSATRRGRGAGAHRSKGEGWWYVLAGLLCGLAGLSHLYGLFWLPVLVLLAVGDKAGWRNLVFMGLGFALPWLPYLLYVWSGWPDWLGQTRDYAPRFNLLDPGWYLSNLWREPQRYGPGLGSPGLSYLYRPGLWAAVAILPVSLFLLARKSVAAGGRAARLLLGPAVLLPLLLALLIYLKLANYLVLVVPLLALTGAWGALRLWHSTRLRPLLLALFLAVVVEGASRVAALEAAAAAITPYSAFIGRVHEHIPAGSRVLGLHHYWLGFEDIDYRSWAVPLLQTDAVYWRPPLALAEALDRANPDVILLDPHMAGYFADHPENRRAADQWMVERGFALAAVVEDSTYGRIEIYQRSQPPAGLEPAGG